MMNGVMNKSECSGSERKRVGDGKRGKWSASALKFRGGCKCDSVAATLAWPTSRRFDVS